MLLTKTLSYTQLYALYKIGKNEDFSEAERPGMFDLRVLIPIEMIFWSSKDSSHHPCPVKYVTLLMLGFSSMLGKGQVQRMGGTGQCRRDTDQSSTRVRRVRRNTEEEIRLQGLGGLELVRL
jgi:acyl-CoA-binding protein